MSGRKGTVRLKGHQPHKAVMVPFMESLPPRRAAEVLDAEILTLLAEGPQFRDVIRERLHEPTPHVQRALNRLRDAKQVKVVGKGARHRKWALRTWVPLEKSPWRKFGVAESAKKPQKTTESWWATPQAQESRAEFGKARAGRQPEMAPASGPTVRYTD